MGRLSHKTPPSDTYISWLSLDKPSFTAPRENGRILSYTFRNSQRAALVTMHFALDKLPEMSKQKNGNAKLLGEVIVPISQCQKRQLPAADMDIAGVR